MIEKMNYKEVVKGKEDKRRRKHSGNKYERRDETRNKASYYKKLFPLELPDEIFLVKIEKEFRDLVITIPIIYLLAIPFYLLIEYGTDIHKFEPWTMWSISIVVIAAFLLLSYRGMLRNRQDIYNIDYPAGLVRCLDAVPNSWHTAFLIVITLFTIPNMVVYILMMISTIVLEIMIYKKNKEWILDRFNSFKSYQKRVTSIQMAGMKTTNMKWFFGPLIDRFSKKI